MVVVVYAGWQAETGERIWNEKLMATRMIWEAETYG